MSPLYAARPPLLLLLPVLLTLGGCAGRQTAPLPAEAELEPDRLMLFVHGYMADHGSMVSFVDAFTRDGIALEGREEPLRVHGHVFDYGRFTRAGAGDNQSMEELVAAFSKFYETLPDRCPVCRRRAERPVEVTLVGHSLGGMIVRDFLVGREGSDGGEVESWEIAGLVTMGTPFFGSSMTRLTQGFLSIIVNGLVRTAVLGFVRPVRGGSFGNTLDPQARAVRLGSPYLWESYGRWTRHLEREDHEPLPWLHVIALGASGGKGDGITRFSSTNIAPLLPEGAVETLLVDVRHGRLVRLNERGRRMREQSMMMEAIVRFMEAGTLEGAPSFRAETPEGTEQAFFVQNASSERVKRDLERKRARLQRALRDDSADVWLRFYEMAADPADPTARRPRVLGAPPSFFRTKVERSPFWLELQPRHEPSADGELVPTVYSLRFQRSQLVSIPDITPTGDYRMHIRLARGVVLSAEHVTVMQEGESEPTSMRSGDGEAGVPITIRPLQANLLHVILDGEAIRREHPGLDDLDIREVALIAEDHP